MMIHPYRGASDIDPGASEFQSGPACFFCKLRRAIRAIRLRSLLIACPWLLYAMVNVATAYVAGRSLLDAKRILATAHDLDKATRARLDRYEAQVKQPAGHPQRPPKQAPPAKVQACDPVTPAPTRVGQGILQLSPTEFYVDRKVVEETFENGAARTHLVPEMENGKISGVRVVGVGPEMQLGMLGIQSGDSIQVVDGVDITRPDKLLDAYARLRTARDVTVRLQRGGSILKLRYHLV